MNFGLLWLILFFSSLTARAASEEVPFEKVPRTIKKEPAYQDKPRYALIALGESLQHRHWLVLDGKTLYFDRNGNGDLTEQGERIEPTTDWSDTTLIHFQLGELKQDDRTHIKLGAIVRNVSEVRQRPEAPPAESLDNNALTLEMWGEFAIPGFRGRCDHGRVPRHAGPFDQNGYLLWKNTPVEASIIHFGEFWSVQLQDHQPLLIGVENHIGINVGSRGFGTGTFAKLGYEKVVPEGIHPRLKLRINERTALEYRSTL
ncbi:MAG: hypothetical protein JNJ77_05940 [Planctomycetia bacterium]|nr:hypothetical protein [Planctomycetia bacterium]